MDNELLRSPGTGAADSEAQVDAGRVDRRDTGQEPSGSRTPVLEGLSIDNRPRWIGSMDLPGMDGDGLPD